MATKWLYSAVAALAFTATPVLAVEMTPEAPLADTPEVQQPAQPEAAETTTPAPQAETAAPQAAAQGVQLAQGGTAPGGTAPGATEKTEPAPAAPKFTYGGSVDFYWMNNFNNPFGNRNLFRAFDVVDQDGINLGLIDVWAQYARDPIGARVDLNFGPTSRLFNAAEPSNSDGWDIVQQAFVSANLTKSGKTYIDLGKWVSTAGIEVAEPKDNWLYSRSFQYNLVQPFFHLGGRVWHYFNDTDYVVGGVHRGYNAVSSPNHDPGFFITGSKMLSPKLTVTGSYYGGEEAPVATVGKSYRSLVDVILAYSPGGRLAYNLNLDAAIQDDANVFSFSLQGKYALNARQYLASRVEYNVDDGFIGTDIGSFTLGFTHMFNKYAQARAEFRYDWADGDVFQADRVNRFTSNQPTFLISTIFNYN